MSAPLGLLLIRLCKAYRHHHEAALRDLGLFLGQDRALAVLAADGPLDQTELAARLLIEPPTVTRMVQRLAASGLVERQSDPHDARRSLVAVTEQGRALLPAVEAVWQQTDAHIFGPLTDDERAQLAPLLQRLQP